MPISYIFMSLSEQDRYFVPCLRQSSIAGQLQTTGAMVRMLARNHALGLMVFGLIHFTFQFKGENTAVICQETSLVLLVFLVNSGAQMNRPNRFLHS